MLVYCKNPNGIIHIERYRIYGINCGHDPVDIPYKLYEANKLVLTDATYREGYLNNLFNSSFQEVAFKYSELRYLPHKTLNKILRGMNIEFEKDWTHKRKVENIKMVLRHVS